MMLRITRAAVFSLFLFAPCLVFAQGISVRGRIVDPQGRALPKAGIQFVDHKHILARTASSPEGAF